MPPIGAYLLATIMYMFSGIVQETGTIETLQWNTSEQDRILDLTISSNELIKNLKNGSSIAVNGCCLTVTNIKKTSFTVQVTEETLKKTNLADLKINSKVNLEPSLKLGEAIDGHLVSGHVDITGKVSDIKSLGENKIIEISFNPDYQKYIAPKGSITVNGVSLTIIEAKKEAGLKPAFTFTLIPFTKDNTNLGLIKIDDPVNLEVDLLSRYIVNYLENKKEEVKI